MQSSSNTKLKYSITDSCNSDAISKTKFYPIVFNMVFISVGVDEFTIVAQKACMIKIEASFRAVKCELNLRVVFLGGEIKSPRNGGFDRFKQSYN
jgi:hypothetical protein